MVRKIWKPLEDDAQLPTLISRPLTANTDSHSFQPPPPKAPGGAVLAQFCRQGAPVPRREPVLHPSRGRTRRFPSGSATHREDPVYWD